MKLLVVTSLLFFTNFLHNTWNKEYPYAWLFLLLTCTSFFVHSGTFIDSLHFHNQIVLLDKSVIFSIFTYGLYLYWKSSDSFYPIIAFITVVLIYSQIYHLHQEQVIVSHGLMHIIGSIGHHCIIYDYYNYTYIRKVLYEFYTKQGIASIFTMSNDSSPDKNCLKYGSSN